jgi:hypothetical protein
MNAPALDRAFWFALGVAFLMLLEIARRLWLLP